MSKHSPDTAKAMKGTDVNWTGKDDQHPTVFVLVRDAADPSHGEIQEHSDPEEASRMIETLLDSGCEQDRIQVFTGTKSEIAVAYRPVVTIAATTGAVLEGRLSDHLPKVTSDEAS